MDNSAKRATSDPPCRLDADACGAASRGLIAYFAPDLADAAVRRRVRQWRFAGYHVLSAAFSRQGLSSAASEDGHGIGLGRLRPLSRTRRLLPFARAAFRLWARRRQLAAAEAMMARNLDMVLLALLARRFARSRAPVIYEALDVSGSCTRPGLRGAALRRLERWTLAQVDLLVVSAPQFAIAYYEGMLGYRGPWMLFENKLPKADIAPASAMARPGRATVATRPAPGARAWRIGWFGYLDDERNWRILRRLAERLPSRVEIEVRGVGYTRFDMNRFLSEVERLPNVRYGGPFRNPDDLAEIYRAVDIVWTADFNFPTANSRWLLTNGLYEAGWFGVPALGLAASAVGEALAAWGSGWGLEEPTETSIIDFFTALTPEAYEAARRAIAALPPNLFVETDEIDRICAALRDGRRIDLRRGWVPAPRPRAQPSAREEGTSERSGVPHCQARPPVSASQTS